MSIVGISLKTRKEWLDVALDQLIHQTETSKIRSFLDEYLKEELPGKPYREKTLGIIQRIWINVPTIRHELRSQAITLAANIPRSERIWLHWGMTALAYPYFRDSAQVIGRLLNLQDSVSTTQVHARMTTKWGDRATIKDAVQRLTNTLTDWNILEATTEKAIFQAKQKIGTKNVHLQLWFLHALLSCRENDEIELQQLMRLPEAYPFNISLEVADIRSYQYFNIYRQGINMDMVGLSTSQHSLKKPSRKRKDSQQKSGMQQLLLLPHDVKSI